METLHKRLLRDKCLDQCLHRFTGNVFGGEQIRVTLVGLT